ncbi:MAG TPA: DivIVA domain-containing protein [Candidatus Pullichristensenella excrementigallinarum]|uniref:DivIVA domain-containing protein n=1 Tax=Candidatus Pullichristensenella excrementigallinarum TaxID=2840907 RepID=A0A9D1I9B6_9FIRM|nr:DivIVA domain-containing protein [Candidatus Pullichristensenella excrementigallinarum]
MPISVKDIQEKEFSRQKRDGYMVEEVDDFLDEIADQLAVLIRENMALAERVKGLEAEKEASVAGPVEQPAPAAVNLPASVSNAQEKPAYDEPSYFKNLEATLRETLINAQRIADDTVAEARKKAEQLIASAEEQAASITANAKAEVEGAKAEAESMKKAIANYRSGFRRLVEDQVQIIKDANSLFD